MNFEKIILIIEHGIAKIRLNSPHNFNSMSRQMITELIEAIDICDADTDVRVIIISGEGKAFCAGGDLKNMHTILQNSGSSYFADQFRNDLKLSADAARRIRRVRVPVIAAVRGAAAGAGCNLALQCDFKVVTEDAKFIEAFVNVGLIPDMGGTFILSRYLPLSRLNEALMLGRPITEAEALDWGLVNRVVPSDMLETEAEALASRLSQMPRLSLAKIKRLVNVSLLSTMDAELEAEEEYQHLCACSDDCYEGVQAFVEKRRPNYNRMSGK